MGAPTEPIALVGLACRTAGATNAEELWRLLCQGQSAIADVPHGRRGGFDRDRGGPCRKLHAGWLSEIDRFDPAPFGISPREAKHMDPQQRIMLELSWEALEDAGIPVHGLRGRRAGVYFGVGRTEYAEVCREQRNPTNRFTVTGLDPSLVSARVSYALKLRGPCLVVQASSASSLAAVHLACQSLWNHECVVALAGGVNLILGSQATDALRELGALAEDGVLRPFDSGAAGYVRGEGAGVVALMRLSDARTERCRIHCLVRSSVMNHDGASPGLTAPSAEAQRELLGQACAAAGIHPHAVDYVEAHGTGTPVGDAIEVESLGSVFADGRRRPLWIGSVKPNIGHLEAAAGVASLIKIALCLGNGRIPPTLNVARVSPRLRELRLAVPMRMTAWRRRGRSRIGGVSAFSLGGTNCHLVVEELPRPRGTKRVATTTSGFPKKRRHQVFVLSAHSAPALRELASLTANRVSDETGTAIRDLCYTSTVHRSHHAWRLGFVCRSRGELLKHLKACARRDLDDSLKRRPGHAGDRLVFVFPGPGNNALEIARRMGTDEPAYREQLQRTCGAFANLADKTVLDSLFRGDTREKIHPLALFAAQLSLAAMLQEWGLTPDVVLAQGWGSLAAEAVANQWSRSKGCERAARNVEIPPDVVWAHAVGARGQLSVPPSAGRGLAEGSRLSSIVRHLARHGTPVFVDLGPDPVLRGTLQKLLSQAGGQGVARSAQALGTARVTLLETITDLYARGHDIAWHRVSACHGRVVTFPPYPWQRRRYWLDGVERAAATETLSSPPAPALSSRIERSPRMRFLLRQCRDDLVGDLLETYLRVEVADLLQLDPADVDLHRPLLQLGLDSLSAMELQGRIAADLALTVPLRQLLSDLTLWRMTDQLLTGLGQVSNGLQPDEALAVGGADDPTVLRL